MQKQTVRRININLTAKEERALDEIKTEYITRNWKPVEGDIIREAIKLYCLEQTGINVDNIKNP